MADSRRNLTLAAAAAARKRALPQDWRSQDAGIRAYTAARADAQRQANADGYDRGLEWNDLMKSVHVFLLPRKHNRYGHETLCEVVCCEDVSRAQPGHGPCATRPPSLTGPDFHGLQFDAQKNLQRAQRWHAAHPQFNVDFGLAPDPFCAAHESLKAELAQPFWRA